MRQAFVRFQLGGRQIICALTAVVLLLCCQPVAAESVAPEDVAWGWSIETVATAHANYFDMEIDSRGMIHVVFHDDQFGGDFYLRRSSPGVWSDWAFPYSGSSLLLDFDPVDETGYVLYRDHSTFDLMLAWRTVTGDWTNTVALVAGFVDNLSFEMYGGTAHIAYVTPLNEVMYHHFDPNGSSWGVLLGTAIGLETPAPSLAVRSDGVPRISYDLDGALYYATTTDMVAWTSNVVDDSAANVGRYSSLALDSADMPSISYRDSTNGDLKYAFYNPFIPGWTTSMVAGVTSAAGELTSMALDPRTDYPRISSRAFDCAICLHELVGSGQWAETEVTDGNTYRRKVVVNSLGDVMIAFHAESGAGVNEFKLAVDNRRIFTDDFELGNTNAWSASASQ